MRLNGETLLHVRAIARAKGPAISHQRTLDSTARGRDSRWMHLQPILHVLTHDVRLGRALVDLCRRVEGLQIGGIRPIDAFAPGRASLVLSPTPECTTGVCEQIVRAGAKVIVLAPVPRDAERLAYIGVGAHAYLPMELRSGMLLSTVHEASDALRELASFGRD